MTLGCHLALWLWIVTCVLSCRENDPPVFLPQAHASSSPTRPPPAAQQPAQCGTSGDPKPNTPPHPREVPAANPSARVATGNAPTAPRGGRQHAAATPTPGAASTSPSNTAWGHSARRCSNENEPSPPKERVPRHPMQRRRDRDGGPLRLPRRGLCKQWR